MKIVEKVREIKKLEAEIKRLEKEKSELGEKLESLRKSYSHLSEQLLQQPVGELVLRVWRGCMFFRGKYSPKGLLKGLEKYRIWIEERGE